MKLPFAFICLTLNLSISNAQDWAKLDFYKEKNKLIESSAAQDNRVVFMGNSITQGWDKFYPDFFLNNSSYVNRGIGGQTTPQMLVRFRQDVIELSPKLVVLMAGTNDIAENTGSMSLEVTLGMIVSMVELAKSNGIDVILCSILPAKDFPWHPGKNPAHKILVLNSMIQDYAQKQAISYVDFYSSMVNNDGGLLTEYSSDGVHPNKEGYLKMEPIIQQAIKSVLK